MSSGGVQSDSEAAVVLPALLSTEEVAGKQAVAGTWAT